MRFAGVASARLVGFDSGKMIGRSQYSAISLTIASVKAPPFVEVPSRIVGRTLRMTSARVMWRGSATSQPATSSGERAHGFYRAHTRTE